MKQNIITLFAFLTALYCAAEVLPLSPGESRLPTGGANVWQVEGIGETKADLFRPGWMKFHFPGFREQARAVLTRTFDDLPVGDFDQLVCNVSPYNSRQTVLVALKVTTDKGVVELEEKKISPDTRYNTDLVVDLDGAQTIKSVRIECATDEDEVLFIIHNLLFRHKKEFAAWQNYWKRFDDIQWEGLIKSESYNPTFELRHGLLFSREELDAWREKHIEELNKSSPPDTPEKAIVQYMRTWNARGYETQRILNSGTVLAGRTGWTAFQSVLFRDPELMRLAARYLLSLCTMESWDRDPEIVGSGTFAAFGPSSRGFEAAFALDCVGEMLTPRGYDYVLKMLMYKAFMPVTYSGWSRPFNWVSNQGPSFQRGKLASLLMAERRWERVKPYTDLAKAELDEMVGFMFRPDGSFMECSAGYLNYTVSCMMPAYQNFATMRGKELSEIISSNVGESGAYAQILASSSKHPQRVITTIGEVGGTGARNLRPNILAFMALACPESMWVNLFNKVDGEDIEKNIKSASMGSGIIFSREYERLKTLEDVTPENLIVTEEAGLACSWRDSTKIIVVGDAEGVGKKHQDVGSFILEYEGDIYAMDMAYLNGVLRAAQYHNMLVSLDEKGEFGDSIHYNRVQNRDSMRAQARGDAREFHAVVKTSASWAPEHFEKWVRTIDSPDPENLTITDNYTLGSEATGAAFIWLTYLPVEISNNKIVITGEYGSTCEITAPEGSEIIIDKFTPVASILKNMTLPEDHECTRIIIKKSGTAGKTDEMQVKVRLLSAEG